MSKASSVKSVPVANSPSLNTPRESIASQLEARQIRVLLVPLGNIPERRLNFYKRVISECHNEAIVEGRVIEAILR